MSATTYFVAGFLSCLLLEGFVAFLVARFMLTKAGWNRGW